MWWRVKKGKMVADFVNDLWLLEKHGFLDEFLREYESEFNELRMLINKSVSSGDTIKIENIGKVTVHVAEREEDWVKQNKYTALLKK